ncbi:MAG: ABC transporter permease [Deltaproteobacteria bacterium]|jgi:peptide/nickel transport system permease protein|nr:ABC transporter permease [Deltaproteobacteria bacterium]MBT4637708.1 ABC transporter permease [Deltaproteobacteria bacterium]MBT6501002.1 ABC transporter permease [Deltaproteobacteria bacterium]MBT6613362.1 ABC transporter permease [Deltaproteobacteria bacterium]MBT7714548.1 ABC transporter permease [Deltaproteobacteria bacterium]
MARYFFGRLISTIPVLLGITLFLFFILRALPGDPAAVIAGQTATDTEIELIRHQLGLDKPVIVQYKIFMTRLVMLDLGNSTRTQNPVIEEIRPRLVNTVLLALVATLIACILGIPAGIVAAVRPYTWMDNLVTILALFGMSMPAFWLGLMLIVIFSVNWHILPVGGAGGIEYLVLPAITLAAYLIASIARNTRSSMMETLSQDYITTAHAKGVSEKVVIWRHALKNSFIPIITVIGLQFGSLLGGTVLTETVFAWPGIGRLLVSSILGRDYPMIQGIILVFALLFVLTNILVDLIYVFLDPKVRYG